MDIQTAQQTTELTVDEARQKWLQKRQKGIGASDAAAILGLSPWKAALTLWAEKSELLEPVDLGDKEYVEWGNILEGPIATRYVAKTGRTLIDHGRYDIRFSDQFPWMHCTIDREIVPIEGNGDGPGDLSIKNVGAYKLKDWETEPPVYYQVQLQHELIVLGWTWGSFAILIGGNTFHWLDVARNDKFCKFLIEKEEGFWDSIQRGNPPAPDSSDAAKEVLLRLYPKDTGESVELPPDASYWIERRSELKAQEKLVKSELQEMENNLKAAIGEASIGLLPDGSGMSWKRQHRKGYTVAASEYRVLREIKGKGRKK